MTPEDTQSAIEPSRGAGDRRRLLQDALAAIERLQGKLDALEAAAHEPIAIVGIGMRAPGGVVDAEGFWRLLVEGRDVVGEVPPDRWDVDAFYDPDPSRLGKSRTKRGGFLDSVSGFEPSFFGMSPREAVSVDPQQRLLLETSWEALEDAGIAPDRLDGSRTGVFVGISTNDYAGRIDVNDPERSDIYVATGTALNAAAGRVSFSLGLQGPCMAIDTACSSSLVALHVACQSLRARECELALAGGVNLILAPEPYVLISKWGMLSPDGRCKTFDASANGFVRGEGCAMIALERLSDAVAAGHRVLAVIRGSAINQDGRSSGLTVPNGPAQQAVVRQALAAARVAPVDVSYVEAHGTGTALGDPIEVEALASVYGEGRPAGSFLEVGSVKSNIGHLEAASGVMSLIKLTLAMRHRTLPPSLHVLQPSPAIPWDRIPVRVCTSLHGWEPAGRRMAGVSAFGFSGMNAHLIVEEAPEPSPPREPARAAPWLLAVSARSGPALESLARRYATHLLEHTELEIADVCATASAGRAQHGHRLAILAPDRDVAIARLREAAEDSAASIRGSSAAGARVRVAFLFTGQGSQYAGMGREIYETEAVFRAAFDRCAEVIDPMLGASLHSLVFEGAGDLSETGNTQPALYALQVALAALWQSWGVEPVAVAGHSVGEFAAAAVAGVFSIEDGARLIAARGKLMQALPTDGAMLALQGDDQRLEAAVTAEVAAHAQSVSIAARNAPGSIVISGAAAQVEAIGERLVAAGFRAQRLAVSHAFHSPLMEPMVGAFAGLAAGVTHAPPTVAWYSTLDGAAFDARRWSARMADYWAAHVREPVAFSEGIGALLRAGCEAVIEIGPHPVLIGTARLCFDALGPAAREPAWLPSLHRAEPARLRLLESVARFWALGGAIDWSAFHGHRPMVALPTYPFQRQSYLLGPRTGSNRTAGPTVHPLLGTVLDVAGVAAQFERVLEASEPAWIADHCVGGVPVVPMTAYLEMARAAGEHVCGGKSVVVESLEVGEMLALPEGKRRVVQVVVGEAPVGERHSLRIFSREVQAVGALWALHATATVAAGRTSGIDSGDAAAVSERCVEAVDLESLYASMRSAGVEFGPAFRGVTAIRRGQLAEAVAEVECPPSLIAATSGYGMHPALLDACTHAAADLTARHVGGDSGPLYLPVGVDRFELSPAAAAATGPLRSVARQREDGGPGDVLCMDLTVVSASGEPVARLSGIRSRRVERAALLGVGGTSIAGWMHDITWPEAPLEAREPEARTGTWILLEDEGAVLAAVLAARLARAGADVVRVAPGVRFDESDGSGLRIDPASAADYQAMLATASRCGPIVGVVNLWPLRVPALGDDNVPGELQRFGTDAALLLLQAIADSTACADARVWVVTRESQAVDGGETLRLEQAPLAGLVRVAAAEYESLAVTHVDLGGGASPGESEALAAEVLANDAERQVALRKGARRVARLAPHVPIPPGDVDAAPVRLDIEERGTLEKLRTVPDKRRAPGPGEIEIRVRASGLNFRDVLYTLGMYPGHIDRLGSDCAGDVLSVGAGVTAFRPGDRVVAMTSGAFASHTVTREAFVAALPRGLDFEQGAAIPTAYLTAWITLVEIARIKRGDRVLIHSGAGGVGMAAIALAVRAGAEVFATAGSTEKRALIAAMGVAHPLDSRSTSFADEVHRLTGGRGVDVVLNSLAGELMDRSFEVLADGGAFLEIGKRGLWSRERVDALGRGLRYHIVDCNDNARDTPDLVGSIFRRVLDDIASGALPALPCTTFAFDRARDAFRYMAQARHVGRVVFRHPAPLPPAPVIGPDAAYLVTGGLGGLGLAAARWLAAHGARHLVLAGRSSPTDAAREAIDAMRADGAEVVVVSADAATRDGIERMLDAVTATGSGESPLGGIIHCAGMLDDGALRNLTPDRFAAVMGPKADGAWRLDRRVAARRWTPDFIVYYASMSAVFGAPGQGNYAAANAFLDALAQDRRARGIPTTSIDWGAWSGAGMAARGNTVVRAATQGLGTIDLEGGLRVLEAVLRERPPRVAVSPFDLDRLGASIPADAPPGLLSDLLARRRGGATPDESGSGHEVRYIELEPIARREKLADLVRRELGTVLGLGAAVSSIPEEELFSSVGIDSLTAVELRNRIQRAIGRPLPATAAMQWPSIAQMANGLASLFEDVEAQPQAPVGEREVIEI